MCTTLNTIITESVDIFISATAVSLLFRTIKQFWGKRKITLRSSNFLFAKTAKQQASNAREKLPCDVFMLRCFLTTTTTRTTETTTAQRARNPTIATAINSSHTVCSTAVRSVHTKNKPYDSWSNSDFCFFSRRPDTSSYCETTDNEVVCITHCPIQCWHSKVFAAHWGGTARLGWLGRLVLR